MTAYLSHTPRGRRAATLAALLAAALTLLPGQAPAQTPASAQDATVQALDSTVLEAREAARKRDRSRLAAARAAMQAGKHPLTGWVEYWDLASRLKDAQLDEVEAFYRRWAGSYVEDRLRNDWLLELGRRGDWANLARDYPRFRMNDDREVSCWWLYTEQQAGREVADAARRLWAAQREVDEGCNLLAATLLEAGQFTADDVYRKARLVLEMQRPVAARAAVELLGKAEAREAGEALDNPTRYLKRGAAGGRMAQELRVLALMRMAQGDPDAAIGLLEQRDLRLDTRQSAWVWSYIGRQFAFRLSTDAVASYQRGIALLRGDDARNPGWSDETLAWGARAALRGAAPEQRWPLVLQLIGWMSPAEQTDPAWVYWKARALQAGARLETADAAAAEKPRDQARRLLEGLAGATHFYAKLAAEDLGRVATLPPTPAPLSAAERAAAADHPGLGRALQLVDLGLRDEARREWNFSLRGMADRELLAAAQLACDREDWQLCINTAERTRTEIDTRLRYPTPMAADISRAAELSGLDPALVFGLIRQETRFMPQLRSHAGASGLMQVMPATARWTARKIGMEWRNPALINDPATNLKLGTSYLKLVLEDLDGSLPMAAAAYNAGPGRPRRWREGPLLDAAVWAENIPFNETRDYVKKVLSNAAVYGALLDGTQAVPLRPRLGTGIGPRDAAARPTKTELP